MTADVRDACRGCGSTVPRPVLLSLGELPLGNTLPAGASAAVRRLPLALAACPSCSLVQTTADVPADALAAQHRYATSASAGVVAHGRSLAARLIDECALTPSSRVVEVGCNDGSVLVAFAEAGMRAVGIEADPDSAQVAADRGIDVRTVRLDGRVARGLRSDGVVADLVLSMSVLEVVPDPAELAGAIADLLAPGGAVVVEVPDLVAMTDGARFDSISHVTASWFTVTSIVALFAGAGLDVVDAERDPFRGGVLRVTALQAPASGSRSPRLEQLLQDELRRPPVDELRRLGVRLPALCDGIVAAIRAEVAAGRRVACYGAGVKASTLLNACGLTAPTISFAVDAAVERQGGVVPGAALAVLPPSALLDEAIDVALLAAMDASAEIIEQNAEWRARGGRFLVPLPIPALV